MNWSYNENVPVGEEVLVQYKYYGVINPALHQYEAPHDVLVFNVDEEINAPVATTGDEYIYPGYIYRWIKIRDLG